LRTCRRIVPGQAGGTGTSAGLAREKQDAVRQLDLMEFPSCCHLKIPFTVVGNLLETPRSAAGPGPAVAAVGTGVASSEAAVDGAGSAGLGWRRGGHHHGLRQWAGGCQWGGRKCATGAGARGVRAISLHRCRFGGGRSVTGASRAKVQVTRRRVLGSTRRGLINDSVPACNRGPVRGDHAAVSWSGFGRQTWRHGYAAAPIVRKIEQDGQSGHGAGMMVGPSARRSRQAARQNHLPSL
jgi:hypothetical protein